EGERLPVPHAEQERLPGLPLLPPFVEAAGRDEAAALAEGGAEGGPAGDRFGAGVEAPRAPLGCGCPRWHQPPLQQGNLSGVGLVLGEAHQGRRLAWGDVVAGRKGQLEAAAEQPGQLGAAREEREATAQTTPRPKLT